VVLRVATFNCENLMVRASRSSGGPRAPRPCPRLSHSLSQARYRFSKKSQRYAVANEGLAEEDATGKSDTESALSAALTAAERKAVDVAQESKPPSSEGAVPAASETAPATGPGPAEPTAATDAPDLAPAAGPSATEDAALAAPEEPPESPVEHDGFLINQLAFSFAHDDDKFITAAVIKEVNADILALQEVENAKVLDRFNEKYLDK
jgi:hypothetical protein